jgi:tetratricopeptide (TPR) repeat protein
MFKHLLSPVFLCFIIIISACSKQKTEAKKTKLIQTNVDINENIKTSKAGQRLVPKLKLNKAETLLSQGSYKKALKIYEELSKLTSLTTEARAQLFAGSAECFFFLEKYDEAITTWEKVIAIRKNEPFAYHSIAIVLNKSGRNKEALKRLSQSIKIDNDFLPGRFDEIGIMRDLHYPEEKLKEKGIEILKSIESLKKRIDYALKKNNNVEIIKILTYFLEIPTSDSLIPKEKIKPLLKHKSRFVREKAGFLYIRYPKGKEEIKVLLKSEKNPQVISGWKKALTIKITLDSSKVDLDVPQTRPLPGKPGK